MKFGKQLVRAAGACSEYVNQSDWLDYKLLKKMLKRMFRESGFSNPHVDLSKKSSSSSDESVSEVTAFECSSPRAMKARLIENEKSFFGQLSKEIQKVEKAYKTLCIQAFEKVNGLLKKRQTVVNEKDTKLVTEVHLFVVLVENFAVMNYCGFTKILKKHDKLMLVSTRDKYMLKIVNSKEFSKFDDIRLALESVESVFDDIRMKIEKETFVLFAKHDEISQMHAAGIDRLKGLANVAEGEIVNNNEEKTKRPKLSPTPPTSDNKTSYMMPKEQARVKWPESPSPYAAAIRRRLEEESTFEKNNKHI